MQIEIKLTETDVKQLILNEIEKRLGEIPLDTSKVRIETKSKQNYKSEWEEAAFRVNYSTIE